jgi:DNA-binding LacI/PurR family transcriptional regulator/DNA-binding transcriptional regulator YhcF (GntR family)
MATVSGPRIVEVAERILDDIRRRGLRPGDSYPNTAETAQWLRVSGSTVNRALQLLSQRGVIRRRQRLGTIVNDPEQGSREAAALRRVHLVVREDHLREEGLWADGVLLGLQGALPGVDIQFNFRPEVDEATYVRQLTHDVLHARRSAGLVLIRSSVVTQRLVVASGLPAVVSGTLQPSIRDLPSVDRDQRQIGELLAGHLLRARCRRFLILMRDRLTAGDHATLDGATATLAAAGVPLDAIRLRALPTDAEAITAAVKDAMAGLPGRGRVGCLCRSTPLARGADAATSALGPGAVEGRRPEIVVADAARRSADGHSPAYPCIEPIVTPEAWGATLGGMLADAARGIRPEPYRRIIPVRLWIPEDGDS